MAKMNPRYGNSLSKTGGVIFQGPFRDFGELNSAYAPLRNGVNFPENGFRDFAFDSVRGQWQTFDHVATHNENTR